MKTKMITILLAVMLAMTGCELRDAVPDTPAEKADTQKTETTAENTEDSEDTEDTEEIAEPEVDYTAVYRPVLDELFGVVSGNYDENKIPEGGFGLLEGSDMLSNAGYVIADYSGDGVPELLVGDRNSGMIFALYTVKDGQADLTLEGAYRNAYYLLEDGSIFNRGSAGAAYAILGIYDMAVDGGSLICRDCWFTHEKDGDFSNIVCWHNTTGEMDVTVSEELTMTLDELWAKESSFAAQIVIPELTAFGEYGGF